MDVDIGVDMCVHADMVVRMTYTNDRCETI